MIEEQKTKKGTSLFIIIVLLIGVISISFAYFVAKNFINKNETGEVNVHTADSGGTKLTVENEEASDTNMYPGHKKLVMLTVTALYDNGEVYYNIYWKGTNTLTSTLNYTIYKVEDNPIDNIDITCEKKQEFKASGAKYYEECNLSDEASLGKAYNTGTIEFSEEETKQVLKKQEVIVGQDAPGKKVYYYIVLEYPNNEDSQNDDFEKGYDGIFDIEITEFDPDVHENLKPLLTDLKKEKPNFANTSCLNGTNSIIHSSDNCSEQTNGLYSETTSLGTTYYYRGTVNNNWVKFGKMGTDNSGEDIWWRIIRINEDGTVRLIYAGTGDKDAVASSDVVKEEKGYWMNNSYGINKRGYIFNSIDPVGPVDPVDPDPVDPVNAIIRTEYVIISNYQPGERNAGVGYMYGTPGSNNYKDEHENINDSNAKTEIDKWYELNLKNDVMTSEEINILSGSTGFCGDRSIADYKGYNNDYTNQGYGTEKTYYKAYDRLNRDYKPSFECPNKEDLYTTQSEAGSGNGALTNPIGLITADEVAYAGGKYASNNYGYWLYTGQGYWTLSPRDANLGASLFYINNIGEIVDGIVALEIPSLRPVVNLKPEYLQTTNHDGTIDNPYIATNNI